MKLHSTASLRRKVGFIRDGVRHVEKEWRERLILDSGLNNISGGTWADQFLFALFGDQVSPSPVERNSGAVTFTTSGSACTASGNFFTAQDVGRLIKFDDAGGQEFYISNYTSATLVTLSGSPSPAISGNTATVWYVNQTALESLYAYSTGYGATGGDNGTNIAGNVVTMKRTLLGNPVSAPVTLTEIGFNYAPSNGNIFDRDIIPGGIGLITGDVPLVICELIVTWNHITPLSVGNVCTGFDSSGQSQLCGLIQIGAVQGISYVDSGGNSSNPSNASNAVNIEPSGNATMSVILADFTIPAFSSSYVSVQPSAVSQDTRSVAPYSSGSFQIDKTCGWNLASANGTIYGFAMGVQANLFQQHLNTPFVKSSSEVLSLTTRTTWQRILTN